MIENQKKKRTRRKPRKLIAHYICPNFSIWLEEEQGKKAYYMRVTKREFEAEVKIGYYWHAFEMQMSFERISEALKVAMENVPKHIQP